MTDKQDIHAEMMELADDYAKSTHNDGIHGLSGVSLITEGAAGRHAALARSVTDRLTQAEQEIVALTLSVSNRDARIAELEAQPAPAVVEHQIAEPASTLTRITEKLKQAGAALPAPENKGSIESAMVGGLSIALLLVQNEIETANQKDPS